MRTRSSGAPGCRATGWCSRSDSIWSEEPDRRRPGAHGSGSSGGIRPRRHRGHPGREDESGPAAARLGCTAVRVSTPGEEIARRLAGKKTKPFKYRDKGTMATIGRGAAVVQMLGGRTMKGRTAQAGVGRTCRAPADERGPREGGDRLGRSGVSRTSDRPDHGRNRKEGVMADATAEFFDALGSRGHEPLLERATGTMRFDLRDGKKIDRWLISVVKGDIVVSRRNARADAVLSTDKAFFERIAQGRDQCVGGDAPRRGGCRGGRPTARGVPAAPPRRDASRRRRSKTTDAGRKR